jgi:hypothetical protein
MSATRTPRLLLIGAAAALVASCAPPPPLLDARAAEARIREAAAAGGREDPAASHYLALAERELSRAEILWRVRDAEGARSWARRAAADADVARLLALEVALRDAARRTEADAEALYRKLERPR